MSDTTPHAAPTEISIHREGAQRMGFFTDTTVCIGCKACEVACKQWNDLPSDGASFRRGGSYDHTASLGAATWRHVRFVELLEPSPIARQEAERALAEGAGGQVPNIPASALADAGAGVTEGELPDLVAMADPEGPRQDGAPVGGAPVDVAAAVADMDRWIFMSDVCKHCTNAGCLDACPTGALIRTEFETVVLQQDVCNGCGYCIPSCPFGVVDRSPEDGRASKCTLCYDRLQDGLEPACAKACPTDSIQFGPYDELVDVAQRRVATLQDRGLTGAYLYGAGDEPDAQLAGGLGAFFLLTEPPERYGLPAEADSPIQENVVPATLAAVGAGLAAAAGVALAFRAPPTPPGGIGALTLLGVGAGALEIAGGCDGTDSAQAARAVSERDMRPAVGSPGGPASWRRAVAGAAVGLHQRSWKDAKWSSIYRRDTRYVSAAPADPERVEQANLRGRRGDPPAIVQGPMMKAPVWSREVPVYFWFGGMAAGASFVGVACDLAGDEHSARVARKVALAALLPSPPLLIKDLGRPERFYNMLRIFKPRSPMSMGSWCLTVFGGLASASVGADLLGRRRTARALGAATAAFGGYLGSYTGVLLAATAVPVWARSRLFLGPIFVSTATLTGAATTRLVLTATGLPVDHPTCEALGRVESGAIAAELVLSQANHHFLGDLGSVLEDGTGAGWFRRAQWLARAGLAARVARHRAPGPLEQVASVAFLAAGLCFRIAWVESGRSSAQDDEAVARMARGRATSREPDLNITVVEHR